MSVLIPNVILYLVVTVVFVLAIMVLVRRYRRRTHS